MQLPEVEREVRWPELAALARAAEETGFDSIWVGDHLLYRGDGRGERGPWDCWTTLAALAGVTERVELGPLVACTAFRPPGLLARTAAAVDEVSGGRLRVALGAGWNEAEFRAFGIPFDRRTSRFEEAFELVRRLLAGERVTCHGAFNELEDAVLLPPPARRPPLMVGGTGPRLLAATLPHVDWWNTWFDELRQPRRGAPAAERADRRGVRTRGTRPGRGAAERLPARGARRRSRRAACSAGGAAAPGGRARGRAARRSPRRARDEVILVLDPITEPAIRSLRTALPSG